MKTIIFDIDGTLTDMWPIEKSVLLAMLGNDNEREIESLYWRGTKDTYAIFCRIYKKTMGKVYFRSVYNQTFQSLEKRELLPMPEKFPLVDRIVQNKNRYRYIYCTGGQSNETKYVLRNLGLIDIFDVENSISRDTYRFAKITGLPFKKIKKKFPDCVFITDSESDGVGAVKGGVEYVKVLSRQDGFVLSLDNRNQ